MVNTGMNKMFSIILLMILTACSPAHNCMKDCGLEPLKTSVDVIKHAKIHLGTLQIIEIDNKLNEFAPDYDKFVEWYKNDYYPKHCQELIKK